MIAKSFFKVVGVISIFLPGIMLMSCQKDEVIPSKSGESELVFRGGGQDNNGKQKGKKNDDPDPPADEPDDPFVTTYQLLQADDSDALYRFSISQSGTLMLLESNPNIATWGTDLWGFWSDPFPYMNNEVNYISGLTNTTYHFEQLTPNTMDVTKTLIVQPYPSGTPVTTESHPGIYMLVE